MKALLILCALTAVSFSHAQTAPKTEGNLDQSWTKIVKEKLRINYFSEFLGPGFESVNGNIPDVDSKGNAIDNSEPAQFWNQISIGWNVTPKWRVIFNPRFTLQVGNTDDLASDDGVLRTEDFLLGFQGTLWSNGPWSVWIRPGYRLPTSRFTRDSNWNGEVEWLHIIDRAPQKDNNWGIGIWTQIRMYVPTEDTTRERWRLYNAPYVAYRINDKWRAEVFYENTLQHNEERGKRQYNYAKNTMQSGMTGFTYQINPSLSVFPFIRYYTVRKFSAETMGLGAWISAALF